MEPSKLYFGDENLRAQVERSLTANLAHGQKALHFVLAGSRCGKSTTIRNTVEAVKKQGFQKLDNAEIEAFWETSPERQQLRKALSKLRATINEPSLINCDILCNNTTPSHYIVNIRGDILLPEKEFILNEVLKALQLVPDNIAILVDSPNIYLPLVPGHQNTAQGNKLKAHNASLQQLADAFPALLKIYNLEYGLEKIKETLWERRNEGSNANTRQVLSRFNIDIRTPEWITIFQLLESAHGVEDSAPIKMAYDKAFDSVITMQKYGLPTSPSRE